MKLTAHGIQVDLPESWEGRIFRRRGGDPTLHAASFTLPVDDADFGSSATEHMPHGGAFLALKEYRPDSRLIPGQGLFAAPAIPLPLEISHFHPRVLQVGRPGQAGFQHFFTAAGRPFCLYAVLRHPASAAASARAARAQVARLSEILSTLAIHRRP